MVRSVAGINHRVTTGAANAQSDGNTKGTKSAKDHEDGSTELVAGLEDAVGADDLDVLVVFGAVPDEFVGVDVLFGADEMGGVAVFGGGGDGVFDGIEEEGVGGDFGVAGISAARPSSWAAFDVLFSAGAEGHGQGVGFGGGSAGFSFLLHEVGDEGVAVEVEALDRFGGGVAGGFHADGSEGDVGDVDAVFGLAVAGHGHHAGVGGEFEVAFPDEGRGATGILGVGFCPWVCRGSLR